MKSRPALRPISDLWAWQMSAACRGQGDSLFYTADFERGQAKADRIRRAQALCQSCPVRVECADFAASIGEEFGVWGGATEAERNTGRRKVRHRPRDIDH